MNDDGFRNLTSAIAQQALDDIESAYNYSTQQLIDDIRYITNTRRNNKRKSSRKYINALSRINSWRRLEAATAIAFLESPYWEWLGEMLGVDPDALPRNVKHRIHAVRSKVEMIDALWQEAAV